MSEKMKAGIQDLLPRFTCTDATADFLRSYDYEKGVVKVVEGVFGRLSVKLRGPLGSFSPGMGPPKPDIFIYLFFTFILTVTGALPKKIVNQILKPRGERSTLIRQW